MNCRRFRSEAGQLLQQERGHDPLHLELERHALGCPRCAAHLDQERILAESFHELRLSFEREEAPAEVGERLRQSFLQMAPQRQSQGEGLWWAPPIRFRGVALAAILVAVIAAAVVFRDAVFRPEGNRGREEMAGRLDPSEKGVGGLQEISADEFGSMGVDSLPAVNTDFIDLGGCRDRDCWEGSQLLRVKLPRSSLLYFGLPMNNTLADDRISADVLVGRDGMARAIRFVQITEIRSNR